MFQTTNQIVYMYISTETTPPWIGRCALRPGFFPLVSSPRLSVFHFFDRRGPLWPQQMNGQFKVLVALMYDVKNYSTIQYTDTGINLIHLKT